jgi:hypothetical protein
VVTTIPNEIAERRPANTPVQQSPALPPNRKVIDGQVLPRRASGWTVTGVFALLLAASLLAGLLLSLIQQNV